MSSLTYDINRKKAMHGARKHAWLTQAAWANMSYVSDDIRHVTLITYAREPSGAQQYSPRL